MTTHPRRAVLVLLAAAGFAVTGCGIHDPHNDEKPQTAAPAAAARERELDEHGIALSGAGPGTEPTASPSATPEEAARRYALASNNWTWRNYAEQYRQMTDLAGGRLLAQLKASPVERDDLEALSQAQLTNRAEIAGITRPAKGQDAERRILVVTMENSGSNGAEEARAHHAVYDARLRKYDGGWLVTRWESMP